jgi:hypothetical protein
MYPLMMMMMMMIKMTVKILNLLRLMLAFLLRIQELMGSNVSWRSAILTCNITFPQSLLENASMVL